MMLRGKWLFPSKVSTIFDVTFHVQPKSNKKVKNNRRTKCDKRKVDEIHAHTGRGKAHFVAKIATYAKGRAFH